MKRTMKFAVAVLCMAVLCGAVAAFGGCGSKKQTVTVSGSSSVTPIMEKLAQEYEKTHDVRIKVNMSDSGTGIKDAMNGLNDFGMASRALADDETGIVGDVLCMDGIVLIVNKSCTADDVSRADVKALFEQGTPIAGTTLTAGIGRNAGSGTRKAFDEMLGIEGEYDESASGLAETGNVIEAIQGSANSIGYISFGSLNDKVKAVRLDGVACTVENIVNKTYALQRPFVLVRKEGKTLSAAAQGFFDYILSDEAQSVITGAGYISVKTVG